MALRTTPQVLRFEAATSLPNHCCCWYQDDLSQNLVILKSPGWGPLNRSLQSFSLAIYGHSGYQGASLWGECGLSFGLCWPSVYSRYLYPLSTVFPTVVFHSTRCAFVVQLPFIDNFVIDNVLIDLLVGCGPQRVFNLPHRCHPPFVLHPSFHRLLCLIDRFYLSRVLLF